MNNTNNGQENSSSDLIIIRAKKRNRIMQELCDTEETYLTGQVPFFSFFFLISIIFPAPKIYFYTQSESTSEILQSPTRGFCSRWNAYSPKIIHRSHLQFTHRNHSPQYYSVG